MLKSIKYMSPIFSAYKKLLSCGVSIAFSLPVLGQTYVIPQDVGEFSVLGSLRGDQVLPALSLGATNNFVVWEDNAIDGNGAGIGMALLNKSSFRAGKPVAADKTVLLDQIKPAVAQLRKGEAAFVWESSVAGTPDIYLRLWRNGAFYTSDIRVNSYNKDQQVDPVITPVADGGAIIAWSSYGQDGDMWGVFARKVTATGAAPKKEFQVAQTFAYNQRNPAIATLANGNFVVVWVSENQRRFGSVDVYARIFNTNCAPYSDEIEVNSGTNICSSPAVAGLATGGFAVVWGEKDGRVPTNGWDIAGRQFLANGTATTSAATVNTYLYGEQFDPKIAAGPTGCLVVWTSLGQDGSREGVYGRYLPNGSGPAGDEFKVNTTVANQQIQPTVAWNGVDRFLVVWSGMASGGFDLFGQTYILNPNP